MKKLIFTLAVIFCSLGAFAQFEKGTILAGGSLAFESTKNKGKIGSTTTTYGKTTSFSLAPQAGYFIIDNLAVGAGLDLTLSTFKPEGDGDSKTTATELQLMPFVRYYLEPGTFFQGQFGVGSRKDKEKSGNTTVEQSYSSTSFNVGVGYALFLNDNVAIEPMLGYGSQTVKLKDVDPDRKSIDSGLFLRVGFQIYLR